MAISKFNYNSFNVTPVAGNALSFNSDADGFTTQGASSMVLIKTLTASTSGTLNFVDGASSVVLDDTYPVYVFKFINLHPDASDAQFGFQVSINTGSAYGVAITSTAIESYHGGVQYGGNNDLAQGTGLQNITNTVYHSRAEESMNGTLHLFNPSSTTFVKHFISRASRMNNTNFIEHLHGGYVNTTSAVDAIQFKFAAGNIATGTIKLYGIADS